MPGLAAAGGYALQHISAIMTLHDAKTATLCSPGHPIMQFGNVTLPPTWMTDSCMVIDQQSLVVCHQAEPACVQLLPALELVEVHDQ